MRFEAFFFFLLFLNLNSYGPSLAQQTNFSDVQIHGLARKDPHEVAAHSWSLKESSRTLAVPESSTV